ncbi:hypothetical protein [Neisseria mucosa]|uniref:hypothetical protein n=1 Tax=Neisseria mucosa TaxID=488 RepID=UPI00076A7552|nr:hypothetical protein [Neisseria mucosa]
MFEVTYVTDLSDIDGDYLEIVRPVLPMSRTNDLSHQSEGAQAVFVYRTHGELEAKLFDRIKDVESYLRGVRDNCQNDPREIVAVYILNNQQA